VPAPASDQMRLFIFPVDLVALMLILNESELRKLLSMREVVRAVEEGFRLMGLGVARAPERLNMAVPELGGTVLEMPAALLPVRDSGSKDSEPPFTALGTKIVSVFAGNTDRGIDVVQSFYALLDPETGTPLAIMDGKFITGIRTAAASAVATSYMAPAGQKTLGILGAGVQARFHIEAMIEMGGIARVIIKSRSEIKARELAARIAAVYRIDVEIADSVGRVLTDANVICTCTTSAEPLFDGNSAAPGTHINAVGAFTPQTRELDSRTVSRARVIIDADQSAGVEAGEILIPLSEGTIDRSHVKGTLSDVVLGKVAGRTSADQVTVFKSCGLAIEDLVTASLAYKNALRNGVGVRVAI
jgi:alanine dehydrogenase